MHCILLYRASSKLTEYHYPVVAADNAAILYFRAERVEAGSLMNALDLAKPFAGEFFVNSLPE